jgi:hypothetical protein
MMARKLDSLGKMQKRRLVERFGGMPAYGKDQESVRQKKEADRKAGQDINKRAEDRAEKYLQRQSRTASKTRSSSRSTRD